MIGLENQFVVFLRVAVLHKFYCLNTEKARLQVLRQTYKYFGHGTRIFDLADYYSIPDLLSRFYRQLTKTKSI